jgi:membrane protein DedA with SNARE-associated domain
MNEIIQFLTQHGYALLFVWVFTEQIGLPIPAAPILLAAGALAGQGWLNGSMAFGLAVMGSLLSDILWYLFGRLKGGSVLSLVSFYPFSLILITIHLTSFYPVFTI